MTEDGNYITVKVVRSDGSDGPVSVEVGDIEGSATADSDYTAVAETLSFADGQDSATFRLYINEDVLDEGDEELTLVLSSPQGSATLGARNPISGNDRGQRQGDANQQSVKSRW